MPNEKDDIPNIPDTLDNVASALMAGTKVKKVPVALYSGNLPIGDLEIDCAVLDDGTRVLSERAVHRAFGSNTRPH